MIGSWRSRREIPGDVLRFAVFAVWAAFFASRDFSSGLPKIDDGAQYLLIAKGFAHGLGYENLALPGAPAFVHLPSAFPLMLVGYWWFLAPHLAALKALLAATLCAGAWFAYLWLRGFMKPGHAFAITLAFAANIQFVILSTSVMSEVPTVLCTYAGLWCHARDEAEGRRGFHGWLALLCWLILFRLRINTAPFLLLYLGTLAWRRDFVKAGAGACAAALWLGLEAYWGRHLPETGGYVTYGIVKDYGLHAHPAAAIAALAANYARYLYSYVGGVFGEQLLPWFYYLHPMDRAKRIIVLGLSAWCLAGLTVFWGKHPRYRWIAAAFVLQWIPVFIYWRTLFRYMMPSFPFLLACMVLAAQAAAQRWLRNVRVTWPAWVFLAVVIANQAVFSSCFHRYWDYWSEERATYRRVHAFIRAAPQRPDLVVSIHNYYTYFETGVPSADWEFQWEYLRAQGWAKGKRVWGFFIVPGEGAERNVPLGDGWCLGDGPLLRADAYHSLWEMRPCEADSASVPRGGSAVGPHGGPAS